MNIAYIPCPYKKDVSRGSFEVLQRGPKGVILKMRVYVYILSMVRGGVCVENICKLFCAAHAPSMDRDWRGSTPPPVHHHPAIGPHATAIVPKLRRIKRRTHVRQSLIPYILVLDYWIIHSISSYPISSGVSFMVLFTTPISSLVS